MNTRRVAYLVYTLSLLLLATAVIGQTPAQTNSVTVLARDGRRALPTVELQGRTMVGLDDLATLFQLTVREDPAARAVTVSYRNRTIVLTPDQTLASMSGRLISLPAPLTRQGRRLLVPVEFVSRALALIYDARLDYRPGPRLIIVGDMRVPRVTALYDQTGNALRVTLEITPKATSAITQDPGKLLVRIDADALDAALPAPPTQLLLGAVHATEPNTIQLDLGPRFSTYRSSTPISNGASAQVIIELLPAPVETSTIAPGSPATPSASAPSPDLPVFGAMPRSSIRTVVVDAGHGGDDAGVRGPAGTVEKDVVLAVAKKVKVSIEGRLGVRVLLTRDEDGGTDADTRAAIANNNKADLFISLHANGSLRASARGAAIYYLSLDRFGEEARRQSQIDRERVPVYGGGTREFALVSWELAQAAHVQDSAAFAGFVEQKLRGIVNLEQVDVITAPMRALAGANMPAVLVEMGYLSNPDDEKQLSSVEFQNSLAQALTEAVIAFRDFLEAPATPAIKP